MVQKHALISYARADGKEFALPLYDYLTSQNIQAWLDVYNIKVGTDWDFEIDQGLANASCLIVLLTPGSTISVQVKSEWTQALSKYIPVIPLLIKDCQIPRLLNLVNFIDFREGDPTNFKRLQERLEKLERDHRVYLEELLSGLKNAQELAEHPQRFQYKIDSVKHAIANLNLGQEFAEKKIKQQRSRIALGLESEKQELVTESKKRSVSNRQKIVGLRLADTSTHFRDRCRQRHELSEMLAAPSIKLTSVIGRGGIGKSCLVSYVLGKLENNCWLHTDEEIPVDGILYLSTRTRGITLERIFLDCSELLGGKDKEYLQEIWNDNDLDIDIKISSLLRCLKNGLYIILLDNLEDLQDDNGKINNEELSAFFSISLKETHNLRLLVTSRIPLKLPKELAKFNRKILIEEGLPLSDARDMLRDLDPEDEYGLYGAPENELEALANLVHGVPRGLELIASIFANDPFMTTEELVEDFFEQEKVVQELGHHAFLHLDDTSERILESLAVFNRPVSIVAIDFMLEPFFPGIDVKNEVRRLIKSYSISMKRSTKNISLHPIDRDLVYSKLTLSGNYSVKVLELRAADYYQQLRGFSDMWTTIEDVKPQLLEIEHSIRGEDFNRATKVLNSIDIKYLSPWGYSLKIIAMRKQILENVEDPALKLSNLFSLGYAHFTLNEYNRSIKLYSDVLRMLKQQPELENAEINGDLPLSQSFVQASIGSCYSGLSRNSDALEYYKKALEKCDDQTTIEYGRLKIWEGSATAVIGQHQKAIEYFNVARDIMRKHGDRHREGVALGRLALAYNDLGNFEMANECHQSNIQIVRETGGLSVLGFRLTGYGRTLMLQRRFDEAFDKLNEAINISEQIQNKEDRQYALTYLSILHLHRNELEKAHNTIKKANEFDNKKFNHLASLVYSIISLREENVQLAISKANQAIDYANYSLETTPNFYPALYTKILANFVLSVTCGSPDMAKITGATQNALDTCSAKGVIRFTSMLLDKIVDDNNLDKQAIQSLLGLKEKE